MPHIIVLLLSCAVAYLIFGRFLSAFRQVVAGDPVRYGWLARTMTTNKPLYGAVALAALVLLFSLAYAVAQT